MVISKLFPSGGLQRDCVATANILVRQGHDVTVVTTAQTGPVLLDAKIEIRPIRSFNNARRDLALGRLVAGERHRFDRIVGFNKMTGLDVYYCADPPYADLKRGWFQRVGWKYATQQGLESACFSAGSDVSVIVLQERQQAAYQRRWGAPDSHFRIIPASLNPARLMPERRAVEREAMRRQLGLGEADQVWLAITSVPKVKGVDRTLEALARMEGVRLLVAGIPQNSRNGRRLMRDARRAGVGDRVKLLGYCEDIVGLMSAADLFVHPARLENTGTAILEAIVNGLPAVVTAQCGFAGHVLRAQAGLVIDEPFGFDPFLWALTRARDADLRAKWSANGVAFGKREQLTSGHDVAAALMVGPLWARGEPAALGSPPAATIKD